MVPEGFIPVLAEAVGAEMAAEVVEALAGEPSVSIRLNPSKLRECPFPEAVPIPWSPYGYLLGERPSFTLDPLYHAGCYYVQDSSAMFVGEAVRQVLERFGAGISVLDLCAAPGGKTTDIAASLREAFGDDFSLLANEVMKNRFGTLRANVRTWGESRVGVVSRDPSAFGREEAFDLIVADVPCSGEGMFRKDAKAAAEWSEETVRFCAARQRRILSDVWPGLRPGGVLIYSTCTFNRWENDDNVAWAASELGADILPPAEFPSILRTRHGSLLLPGHVPGEGQYAAILVKHGEHPSVRSCDIFTRFRAERPVTPPQACPCWEVDRQTALHYLHGDALVLPDAPAGLITITYKGHPLGPAKNIGRRCNNLYPKESRIRMDIR